MAAAVGQHQLSMVQLYRHILKAAKQFPSIKKHSIIQQVKTEFRENKVCGCVHVLWGVLCHRPERPQPHCTTASSAAPLLAYSAHCCARLSACPPHNHTPHHPQNNTPVVPTTTTRRPCQTLTSCSTVEQ